MASSRNDISGNGVATALHPATPSHMLAADLLVVDQLITIPTPEALSTASPKLHDQYEQLDSVLNALLAKRGLGQGGKISINEEEFKQLSLAVAGLPAKMEAGGSTADIVTTLKNLRGGKLDVDFLGIAGHHDIHDNLIVEDLRKNGIKLDPGATMGARSAMSFIFRHPDGKRSIITYPGNAAEKLNADMITDERVAKSDRVLIPISLWSKFDAGLPEALLKKSVEQDKEIIITIPKQARFDYAGSEDLHKKVIPYADVIVADEEELARWYKTGTDYQAAITQLHADMVGRDALRYASGKTPRSEPVAALVKHKDDSVTVLVAPSPPGVAPVVAAARYEVPAPPSISGKKHTLGVDDATYAGFIAALHNGLSPQKAAEFALDVAQTKFLYETVRIPSVVEADPKTKERWKGLRHGLGDTLEDIENAIGFARTGVSNDVDANTPRTLGQKAFDFGLYPLLANIGVIALSTVVTYHSSFNQNKANAFVARSSWFKDQLGKLPALGKNPQMVRNLNMVIWSFIDGSLLSPVVAAFESKRQPISRWIDDKMGTTPDDKSVYDKEIQRSWQDVMSARAGTFAFVIATYFALNAKLFPKSTSEGILAETKAGTGMFKRENVNSINGLVFDVPAQKIGGWLSEIPFIRKGAKNISDNQLKGMAKITGTAARKATETDAHYQIEGITYTGLFEFVYSSLCTAGLYLLGKNFAAKRREKQEEHSNDSNSVATSNVPIPQDSPISWAQKVNAKPPIEKMGSYLESVDKSRNSAIQIAN